MFTLEKKQIIKRPLEEVFSFFERPENLEKITPPDLGFIIKTKPPLVMKKNAIFDYTIKLSVIKFPWKTLITKYEPPYLFEDVQKFGPYKKWEHTHSFKKIDENTTEINDTVVYDLYPKFLSKILNSLYIRKKVEKIFNYRYEILNKIFN